MFPLETAGSDAASSGTVTAILAIAIVWIVFVLVAGWKMYVKAGQPGWFSLIPILNVFGLLLIARRPLWWFFLMLIPLVNIVVIAVVYYDIARSFRRGLGTALLLLLLTPIAYLILGFGSARYEPDALPAR